MPRSGSIPPSGEAWLRAACGGDDDLRAEVGRLLAQDERADRDGFLTPPEADEPASGSDGELAPRAGAASRSEPGPIAAVGGRVGRRHRGLHPQGGDRAAHRGRTRSPSPERSCGRGCASCR